MSADVDGDGVLTDVREIDGCTEHDSIIRSATAAICVSVFGVGQCGQHGLDDRGHLLQKHLFEESRLDLVTANQTPHPLQELRGFLISKGFFHA